MLKNYRIWLDRIWLDLYHEAYPATKHDESVQRYGVELVSDMCKNHKWIVICSKVVLIV